MPSLIFTGGHHSSALPVALDLSKKGWKIYWFGHRHTSLKEKNDSAEYREVVAKNIPFYDLKAGKLYRSFHPLKLLLLPWGFIQAFVFIIGLRGRLKSDLRGIVTFGGYLGVPVVVCGWLLRIPVIAHEQTVVAGWANKLISLFSRKIAISWPTSKKYYPSHKVVVTGLPFRPQILQAARKKNNSSSSDSIYVTGGKQGSHILNQVIFDSLPLLTSKYHVVHQTGFSSQNSDYQKAQTLQSDKYRVYDYLTADQVANYLSQSHIVISRSGAHITSELLLFCRRCVLIPLPSSSHNEQLKNAQMLKDLKLAVLLPQSQLNTQTLLTALDQAEKLTPVITAINTNGLKNLVNLIINEFQ